MKSHDDGWRRTAQDRDRVLLKGDLRSFVLPWTVIGCYYKESFLQGIIL